MEVHIATHCVASAPARLAATSTVSMTSNAQGKAEAMAGSVSPDARRPDRIVVVEDDPVTRAMLVGYFSENSFDVVGAGSCAECRQALRVRTDLVFLDVQLPDG